MSDPQKIIRVLVVRVGEPPAVEFIDGGLADMQRLVEGNIELVRFTDEIDLWCNEEARLPHVDMPYNLTVRTDHGEPNDIHGPILFARHDGEGETTSLTDDDVRGLEAAIAKLGSRSPAPSDSEVN